VPQFEFLVVPQFEIAGYGGEMETISHSSDSNDPNSGFGVAFSVKGIGQPIDLTKLKLKRFSEPMP